MARRTGGSDGDGSSLHDETPAYAKLPASFHHPGLMHGGAYSSAAAAAAAAAAAHLPPSLHAGLYHHQRRLAAAAAAAAATQHSEGEEEDDAKSAFGSTKNGEDILTIITATLL